MKETDARQELELDTDAASEPTLDATDVGALLSAYAVTVPSSAGADDGEWDLNRAKAAGWRRKQGRSAQFDGDKERRIFQHCKEMAGHWEGEALRADFDCGSGSRAIPVETW